MKVVVKIGGSLIEEAPEIVRKLQKEFGTKKEKAAGKSPAAEEEDISVLIVPGGGIFANAIREADQKLGIGNEASHWMAVLAMEQYAYYLLEKSGVSGTDSLEETGPNVQILLPYRLLKREDPLPHSWDVTSDTIAAWVAHRIGAKLVKATDVDGVFREGRLLTEVLAPELARMEASCTDHAFPTILLKNRMDCVIVNGKCPERVLEAVSGKPLKGTTVKGNI